MSGIITVKVKTGEYQCINCLKKAIKSLGLDITLNINSQGTIHQLSIQKETEDYLAKEMSLDLENEIKHYHEQILPKYTEYHAIHSLENQGFRIKRTYFLQNGYKIIMEKIIGSGNTERINRYEIVVFSKENRILIDGGDMPGMHCRKNARKFQNTMGKFVNFTPHENLNPNNTQQKRLSKNYLKIDGGRR